MSEEEKAIEILKYTRDKCRESGEGRIYFYRVEDLSNAIEALLNLIEKQQKEIKELKSQLDFIDEQNRYIDKLEKEIKKYKKFIEDKTKIGKDIQTFINKGYVEQEYISKDKIRDKIKEYETTLNQNLFTKIQVIEHGFPKENIIQIMIKAKVEILKELLEE